MGRERLVPGTDGLRFVTHHAAKWQVDASEVDEIDIELEMGEEGFTVSLRGCARSEADRIRKLEEAFEALRKDMIGFGRQANHLSARLASLRLDSLRISKLEEAFKALRKNMIGFGKQVNHLLATLDSLGVVSVHPTAEELTRATREALDAIYREDAAAEEEHACDGIVDCRTCGAGPGERDMDNTVYAGGGLGGGPTQRPMDAPEGLRRAIAGDTRDPWAGRQEGMRCRTCIWYVRKVGRIEGQLANPVTPVGRCRRHAPTMGGYPVVYPTDWCGDHRLDEGKL